MRQPVFDFTTGAKQFDTKVHHAGKDGGITKATPYQLSIVHGHHYYFADGRVYKNNNDEVPFHDIPDQLKKQWEILSPEDQQRAILRQKIALRKKAESDIKAAQEELKRLVTEEKAETAAIAKAQSDAKAQSAAEQKELEDEYQRQVKIDSENKGSDKPGSFGETMEGKPEPAKDDDNVVV